MSNKNFNILLISNSILNISELLSLINTRSNKKRERGKVFRDKVAYSYMKDCKTILDVGCGEGRFIDQDPQKIKGLDANPESVAFCHNLGYDVEEGDVRKLPYEDSTFEGVHCAHLIEHFQPEDTFKILSELDRVLIPGGILVIRSPLLHEDFYSSFTHIRPYNPSSIIRYFTPSGQRTFSIINANYRVLALHWRYAPLCKNVLCRALNLFGFPWIKKTGYMLVMRKGR